MDRVLGEEPDFGFGVYGWRQKPVAQRANALAPPPGNCIGP
jgi:hypothetical protein